MDKKSERLEQIIKVAQKNDNKISYVVAMDMLKVSNTDSLNEKDIESALEELVEAGVEILFTEETEDYGDEINSGTDMYVPADVIITPRNITVDIIADRLQHNEIDLEPAFQRKGGLWTEVQQSRLIESLMLKIPIPTFYFNAAIEEKWVVIDGLQRLTTLHNFMVSKKMRLQGLEYLKEFEGFSYDELPRQYYRRIRETQIQIYTIEKGTPEDIVFNIFKRINTGGLTLSAQEIRHALYQGKATNLIKELASSEVFLQATGHVIKTDRMLDCEYVTRYLAFVLLDYEKRYSGNIDEFLIEAMKYVNNLDMSTIEEIKLEFYRVMNACRYVLGKYAFRKISYEWRRGPINKALFEMWSVCFHLCTNEQITKLRQKQSIVLMKFQNMLDKVDIANAIKSGDKYAVTTRMNEIRKMVEEILND